MTTKLFIKKPLVTLLIHWIIWLFLYFITFFPTLFAVKAPNWNNIIFYYVILASINFILFYAIAFYLLPRIGIRRKKWILLTFICIALAIGFTYIKFRVEKHRQDSAMRRPDIIKTFSSQSNTATIDSAGLFSYRFRRYLQTNIYNTLSIIFIAFAYRLFLAWLVDERLKQQLENEKLSAELSWLKMQINPHFLFNALNNIYALSVIEKSKKTGECLLKLSDLTRYMVYEKEDSENLVSLNSEIKHINNYIDLEKLRHLKEININFSIEGNLDSKRIVPLLLFPLIENTCKHGILTDPDRPVDIHLKVDNKKLNVNIQNFKNDFQKDQTGGVGLVNVKKRLDLIYNHAYKLNITDGKEKFIVQLELPI